MSLAVKLLQPFMRFVRSLLIAGFGLALMGAAAAIAIYNHYSADLPSIEVLRDVRLQVPLRVYSRDYALIAEFGEKRRVPVTYDEIPQLVIDAFISAEDARYYEHPGVDYQGLIRATTHLLSEGEIGPGGSTITMQVARNFFLSNEKTFERKFKEILLALKIERSLGKREILDLYLNKIYLGNRAYGVGAAAQVYYGRPLHELTIAEVAMIAGLPKAPSRFNPVVNPERAIVRRNYVLGRMLEDEHITRQQHDEAVSLGISADVHAPVVGVDAPYVAEMARAQMVALFGEDAYTNGYEVITTVDAAGQRHAGQALRRALEDYDTRHGYRGAEGRAEVARLWDVDYLDQVLRQYPPLGGLAAGVVLGVSEDSAVLYLGEEEYVWLERESVAWARRYINENSLGRRPKNVAEVLTAGDVVRARQQRVTDEAGADEKNADEKEKTRVIWRLAQVPAVGGAFVALNPRDGAVLGLVGGYDFQTSEYNRASQSERQPGSGFKPFLYTAAFDAGFTPATVILDAPVVFRDESIPGGAWKPENYSGKFFGPTRLREAMYKSRNIVAVRLLDHVGVGRLRSMARRFGFAADELPANLTLALGSGVASPLRMATGYAVFANGGFRVKPYLIDRVLDADGAVILRAEPWLVCAECAGAQEVDTRPPADDEPLITLRDYAAADASGAESIEPAQPAPAKTAPRVISPRLHYQVTSMLRDVVKRGTGRRANSLGRDDLAGKTGTTNEQIDAWFNGFHPDLVAVAWVGFDDSKPLGKRETGGRAALPMWIDYMQYALSGRADAPLLQPDGMVTIKIDPLTGAAMRPGEIDGVFETFRREYVPTTAPTDERPILGLGAAQADPYAGAAVTDPYRANGQPRQPFNDAPRLPRQAPLAGPSPVSPPPFVDSAVAAPPIVGSPIVGSPIATPPRATPPLVGSPPVDAPWTGNRQSQQTPPRIAADPYRGERREGGATGLTPSTDEQQPAPTDVRESLF